MASGLIGAGLLSGLGAGLSKGMDDVVQMNMARMREEGENARLDKRLAAEDARADKSMTHDERKQNAVFASTFRLHELDGELADARMDKSFENENYIKGKELEQRRVEMKQARAIADQSDTSLNTRSDKEITLRRELSKNTLDHEKNKPRYERNDQYEFVAIYEDGRIVKIIDPETGKPFKGPGQISEAAKSMGEFLLTQVKGNEGLLRNSTMLTETQRKEITDENKRLAEQAANLYGMKDRLKSKSDEKVLKSLSPEDIGRLKKTNPNPTPEQLNQLRQDLRDKGIDPDSFPSATSAAPQPGVSPMGNAPVTSPAPMRQGGMVTVPAPPMSEQGAMADAVGGAKPMLPPPTADAGPPPIETPAIESKPPTDVPVSAPPSAAPEPTGLVGNQAKMTKANNLTPKDLTTLLTKEQKLAITGLVQKIQSPGIKEKPATRADLQDYLLKALGPVYSKNGQSIRELVADMNEFMAALLPSQKDMSGNGYKYAITE